VAPRARRRFGPKRAGPENRPSPYLPAYPTVMVARCSTGDCRLRRWPARCTPRRPMSTVLDACYGRKSNESGPIADGWLPRPKVLMFLVSRSQFLAGFWNFEVLAVNSHGGSSPPPRTTVTTRSFSLASWSCWIPERFGRRGSGDQLPSRTTLDRDGRVQATHRVRDDHRSEPPVERSGARTDLAHHHLLREYPSGGGRRRVIDHVAFGRIPPPSARSEAWLGLSSDVHRRSTVPAWWAARKRTS
jgi:hypothetical protein